jgi:hypothetical protein
MVSSAITLLRTDLLIIRVIASDRYVEHIRIIYIVLTASRCTRANVVQRGLEIEVDKDLLQGILMYDS